MPGHGHGKWRLAKRLKPGWNIVEFTAVDEAGNKAGASIRVFLVTDEADTETWIEVLHPENGSRVDEAEIIAEGIAEAGAKVSVGDKQIDVTDDGKWRVALDLRPGWNTFKFWAVDRAGNEAHDVLEVFRVTEDTKPDDGTFIEITSPEPGAHVDGPEVVFEGRAEPGAVVYSGDKRTEVSQEGAWRLLLKLDRGWNEVKFVAVDKDGNEAVARTEIFVRKRAGP